MTDIVLRPVAGITTIRKSLRRSDNINTGRWDSIEQLILPRRVLRISTTFIRYKRPISYSTYRFLQKSPHLPQRPDIFRWGNLELGRESSIIPIPVPNWARESSTPSPTRSQAQLFSPYVHFCLVFRTSTQDSNFPQQPVHLHTFFIELIHPSRAENSSSPNLPLDSNSFKIRPFSSHSTQLLCFSQD